MKGSTYAEAEERGARLLAQNDLLQVGCRVHWPFSEAATRPLQNSANFSPPKKYQNFEALIQHFVAFALVVKNHLLSCMRNCRRRVPR